PLRLDPGTPGHLPGGMEAPRARALVLLVRPGQRHALRRRPERARPARRGGVVRLHDGTVAPAAAGDLIDPGDPTVLMKDVTGGGAPYPRRSACRLCECVTRVVWTSDDPPVALRLRCVCVAHQHEDTPEAEPPRRSAGSEEPPASRSGT